MKRAPKCLLTCLLATLMVFTMLPLNALAANGSSDNANPADEGLMDGESVALSSLAGAREAIGDSYDDSDIVRIIVELKDEPLADLSGTLKDGRLTSKGLNLQKSMFADHENVFSKIVSQADEEEQGTMRLKYNYTTLFNGFALECTYGQLDTIRNTEGVERAYVAASYELPVQPKVNTGSDTIGAPILWDLGYSGEGITVAVLDTGIDTDHDAFAVEPENQAFDRAYIEDVLTNNSLNAQRGQPITVDDVYLSGKLPFVYDYAGGDTNVNHLNGGNDHGTHVAGIVGADPADGKIQGVAPQAQLIILKVFPDGGDASSDDILAALEDCVPLGVDVINMSLGSRTGFTYRDDMVTTMAAYERLSKAGINIAAAAGNDTTAARNNQWELDKSLTSNPDNGIVGAPASYAQSLAVASVENLVIEGNYFKVGDNEIFYNDSSINYDPNGQFIHVLGGQTLEYVVVPGYGEASDYEGLDVEGKVALVSRGETNFSAKHEQAIAHGAAACIVYNNDTDGMLNMQILTDPTPCISISMTDGQYMLEAAVDGVGTLYVATDSSIKPNEVGGEPSDFTSWGTTAGLTIKPEIMAPGGNIFSSRNHNSYGLMSGTSMASPHVAGAMAIMLQVMEERYPGMDAEERIQLINTLMMSTATPSENDEGIAYSPRQQGAGLLNIANAIATDAYITVEDNVRPKLELGDDPEKSGVYTLKFEINNTSDTQISYEILPIVLTEMSELGGTYHDEEVYFMSQSARDITGQATITTNWDQDIAVVPANGSAEVEVEITLNDEIKAELDGQFENGIYIEGFVELKQLANEEGVIGANLNVPYLAFYGNWSKAPIIDTGYYWESYNGLPSWSSQYTNYGGSMITGTSNFLPFGVNPYVNISNPGHMPERNSLSPLRVDGRYDKVDLVYTSLLRDARRLTYTITDVKTGEVYYNQTADYAYKSVYSDTYESILPAGAFVESKMNAWYGTDSAGEALAEGTTVMVRVQAELDYEGFVPEENENYYWEFPVTIDNTPPQVVSCVSDGNTLTMEVQDNRFVSYVEIWDADDMGVFSDPIAQLGINEAEIGAKTTIRVNVGSTETLYIAVADYACNRYIFTVDSQTGEIQTTAQFEYVVEDNDEVTITGYTGADMNVVIPDTIMDYPVTAIAEKAFSLESTIRSISIGKNVRSIGENAFTRCAALERIEVDPENEYFTSIDGVLFDKEVKTVIAYPGGKADTTYQVPDGVETIGRYGFYFATFENVVLPESLTTIEAYGLSYCSKLNGIEFPASLTTIGEQAFFGCSSLGSANIHSGITDIGPAAFSYCSSLTGITVADENPNYCDVDGILFSKDMTLLKTFPTNNGINEYTVPDGVKTVESYAFYNNRGMTSIIISDSVETIGAYAFYYCQGATDIVISNNVKTIGDYAFYSCKGITTLNLPESLESIGAYSFAWCQGLTDLNTGNGLKTIGKYAFNFCSSLINVSIGNSVESIGNYAFYSCSKMVNVTFGNSLREVGSSAFSKCSKILAINLPDTVTDIGSSAFNGCSAATTLTLGRSLKTIGNMAFNGCKGFTELDIPEGVTKIDSSAFARCSGITSLSIPATVTEYGNSVFSYCSNLDNVVLPEGMTEIPDSMFMQCTNLSNIKFPSTLEVVGERAFNYCKKLTSIDLPDTTREIGYGAFYYCTEITEVVFPEELVTLGNNAFYSCTKLTNIEFNDKLETIGGFAFYGCSGITYAEIPNSVVSIGTSAFNRCNNMEYINFGTGLQEIGSMAFNYCDKLERFVVDENNPYMCSIDGVLFNKDVTKLIFYPLGKLDTSYEVPSTVTEIGNYGIYSIMALESITLPDGLVTLGEHALSRNSNLKSLRLPASLENIHYTSFYYGLSMTSIDVDPANETFSSIDGVLFNKAQDTLVFYPNGRPDTMYVVPDGVTTIAPYAFYECKAIEGINFGKDVTFIGTYAMNNCTNLNTVKLGDSVESIDAYAFSGCNVLTSLDVSSTLKNIGAYAFANCRSLPYVFLNDVELIGEYAFNNAAGLTRVVFGPNLNTLMGSAFYGTAALREAYFLGDVPANIGANVFKNAKSLTVYYDNENVDSWAPDGQSSWDGHPMMGTTFHSVVYVDANGTTILDQRVADSQSAIIPEAPVLEGNPFVGWSEDASSVTGDMIIKPIYENAIYSIEAGNVNAKPGEAVVVPVSANNLAAAVISVEYDPEVLTYAGYTNLAPEGSMMIVNDSTPGMLAIAVANTSGNYYGEFMTLNFKAAEDASEITELALTVNSASVIVGGASTDVDVSDIEAINGSVDFSTPIYTVTFIDGYTGEVIYIDEVHEGEAATAPEVSGHDAEPFPYMFIGWDKEFSAVMEDMTVTANFALLGDVNFDGEVNITDALIIARQQVGYDELDEAAMIVADVNGDGIVSITDTLLLMRVLVGLETV